MTSNLPTVEDAAVSKQGDSLSETSSIDTLLQVVAQLRDPQTGCPWDLKQTHASLKPYMLEEAYEAVEVIDTGNPALLKEELGDVLLQIVLHSQLAKEAGQFDFAAVCQGIAEKLIRRHPHVFDAANQQEPMNNPEAVTQQWEAIKQAEKAGNPKQQSILEGVPKGIPALSRALETSKRAVKVGFEWPNLESLWACVMSEYDELKVEIDQQAAQARLEEEMGDVFFASVNLARHLKIDPEVALTRATQKFTQRFQTMERLSDKPLDQLSFEEWDELWNQAKTLN